MYELLTDGKADLARFSTLLSLQKKARDPLSGLVDGSNTVFFTTFAPILGTPTVYNGAIPTTAFTLDSDTGEIDFTSAPGSQPYATYTYTPFTSSQIAMTLFAGFDEMELRWPRGLRLSGSDTVYTPAADTDSAVYLMDKTLVSDPVSPTGVYFSSNRAQVAFYMKCCQYAFYAAKAGLEAESGMSYREAGGMSLSTDRRSPNLERLLERLGKDLELLKKRAQDAWYTDGAAAGSLSLSPKSEGYVGIRDSFEWLQTDDPRNTGRNL